jgi:hypothetical protein
MRKRSLMPDQTVEVAVTGRHDRLPGQVWRAGDPLKHLGPPEGLEIPFWSRLWVTRCGLTGQGGNWAIVGEGANDDVWCPGCLRQAGIPHRVESL